VRNSKVKPIMRKKPTRPQPAEDWDIDPNEPIALAVTQTPPPPKPPAQVALQAGATEDLPTNFGELIRLMTRLDNTRGKTREEEIARRELLARVRARAFAMQQGPAAPVWDAHSLAHDQVARRSYADARANRIARLKTLLA
jgi:hypothetical protein